MTIVLAGFGFSRPPQKTDQSLYFFCSPQGIMVPRTGLDGGGWGRTGLDRTRWGEGAGLERHPRSRGFPRERKKPEDPSGSVRDITHHLIHDSETSTQVPCIVFHEESDGYDPGSIQSSYEFLFSDPGARWDPEAGTFLIFLKKKSKLEPKLYF